MATPKKDIYISKDQNFIDRKTKAYLIFICAEPFLLFGFVAMCYSMTYHDKEKEGFKVRGILNRSIDGVSHMGMDEILITCLACIFIVLITAFLLVSFHSSRKIVVELKFNDEQKEVIIKCKTIDEDLITTHVKYCNIYLSYEYGKSDGVSSGVFDVMIIHDSSQIVGCVFKDHFTWSLAEFEEIKYRLM
jgi:hypothetical protein